MSSTAIATTELSQLATEIKSHHSQALEKAASALEHVKQAGELLLQAKSQVPHGGWLGWLSDNCQVSPRQAQRYMQVASNWEAITKNDTVSHLTFRELSNLYAQDETTVQVIETPENDTVSFLETEDVEYEDVDADYDDVEIVRPHVANNSGENEWYTPPEYIEAARSVLGSIDLDPATSLTAQENVKAARFHTLEDNGLIQDWRGNTFLNPPYERGLVAEFCQKLVSSIHLGKIPAAILLTNNQTDATWFHVVSTSAAAVCFVRGRISFIDETGERKNKPLQGQMFLYFGSQVDLFIANFEQFGVCFVSK